VGSRSDADSQSDSRARKESALRADFSTKLGQFDATTCVTTLWTTETKSARRRLRRRLPPLPPRCAELLPVLPHDRGGRFQANAAAAALNTLYEA
jgi:hypothetical protein